MPSLFSEIYVNPGLAILVYLAEHLIYSYQLTKKSKDKRVKIKDAMRSVPTRL